MWKHHLSHINSKISKYIGILYKLRNKLNTKWKIRLFYPKLILVIFFGDQHFPPLIIS